MKKFVKVLLPGMKIAQVVSVFPPYRGGIGNSVCNLAKNLALQGEKVTVFTPDYGLPYEVLPCPSVAVSEGGAKDGRSAEDGADFQIKRVKPLFKFGNAALLPQMMWRLRGFDAIHLHLPFLGATLPVLWFSIFHPKTKLIVTYHMDLAGAGFKKFIFNLYKNTALPLILRRADKIIVSSYDYAENSGIKKFFAKHKNKFIEIPFGVDEHKFYPKQKNAVLAEKYFIDAGDKVILFVGGLDAAHYFKGLDVLMQAAKVVMDSGRDNIKLLIVGEGNLKADYQDRAERLHLRDKMIFAGNVSDADLPDYYNLADIFILPSVDKSEAFGIVLIEAAACGKAAIASNLSGVRTVVRDGETGLLSEPGSPAELAKKIGLLLSDDELRQKMGAAGRKMIEEKYSNGGTTKKYLQNI